MSKGQKEMRELWPTGRRGRMSHGGQTGSIQDPRLPKSGGQCGRDSLMRGVGHEVLSRCACLLGYQGDWLVLRRQMRNRYRTLN